MYLYGRNICGFTDICVWGSQSPSVHLYMEHTQFFWAFGKKLEHRGYLNITLVHLKCIANANFTRKLQLGITFRIPSAIFHCRCLKKQCPPAELLKLLISEKHIPFQYHVADEEKSSLTMSKDRMSYANGLETKFKYFSSI